MMEFEAHVKSVTVNVVKGKVFVSFEVGMDEESMREAENLARYVEKGAVKLVVEPRQGSFEVNK